MPPFPLFCSSCWFLSQRGPFRRHQLWIIQVVPQTSCQLSEGCFTDSWHLNPTVSSSQYFRCFLGLITNELGWPERWTGSHAHTLGKVCVPFLPAWTKSFSDVLVNPWESDCSRCGCIHSSPPTWHSRAPQLTNSHLGPGDIEKKSCSTLQRNQP